MFYDWLVTRHDELLKTLHFGFVNRLFREGYTLPETGNYLIVNVTGLVGILTTSEGYPRRTVPSSIAKLKM